MEEEIYEDIARYIAGEMEGEELRAFEEKLQADPVLQEKVDLYRSISDSMAARFGREEAEKEFKANLTRLAGEHIQESRGQSVRLKWYAWAAAASVVLAAVIFYKIQSPLPAYSDYAVFEPLALTARGEADSLKIQAQELFNDKRYDEALVYFDAILAHEPENTELKIYKAIALLELNKYTQADSLLGSVRATPSVYRDKALWLQALGALKQKDYETCRQLLREISPDAEDHEKAQELLEDL